MDTINEKMMDSMFLAQSAKFICDFYWDINWKLYTQMFGFKNIPESVYRLFRSQTFHDPDYPDNVLKLLNLCFERSKPLTIMMISHIINDIMKTQSVDWDDIKNSYPVIYKYLKGGEIPSFDVSTQEFLMVSVYPDDFYKILIERINLSYKYGLYTCTFIMLRKLIENLLIDILRKKYGMKNIELFFDTKHGRFRMLSELIKKFEERIEEFKYIVPDIKNILEKLKILKGRGNAAAHSLQVEMRFGKDDLNKIKDDVNSLTATLIRIYNNL